MIALKQIVHIHIKLKGYKNIDYVERKLSEGHDLGRMMKHLFGLSRGDKYAKSFRIKILEVIKKNSLKDHKKDLEDLLVY